MKSLLPIDILMLEYINEGIFKGYKFPQFWRYTYNVDPKTVLNKLMNLGLIYETINIETNLNSVTIPVLKDFLREKELKVSGNKPDLIERIINKVAKEEIEKEFNDISYKLSDEALRIIEENSHIIYAHDSNINNYSINLANELHKKFPDLSPFELAWNYVTSAYEIALKKSEWGLVSTILGEMASLMKSEGEIKEAFKYNILLQYLEFSGLPRNITPERIKMDIQYDFNNEYILPAVNEYHMNNLLDYKYNLNLSDKEFSELYFEIIKDLSLPFQFLNDEEILNVINSYFISDYNKIELILSEAEERLLEFINSQKKNNRRDTVENKGIIKRVINIFKR